MTHRTATAHQVPGDDGAKSTSLTLLERAKVQDGDAWRHLVALYTPLLRYWCRRWRVDGEDVNDVVQEIFQAVFCGLKDFRRDRDGDSFRAWLRGVARNKALVHFRRKGSSRSPGGTDFYRRSLMISDRAVRSPEAETEEDRLVDVMYQESLRLVRDEFEPRSWQAFWRTAVDGQPSTLAAEDLGMTPAAVRQAKSRILRRLKEVLGEPLPRAPRITSG